MTGKVIAQKVHQIQNSLSGAKNHPEVLAMLSQYGYDEAKIAEGQSKLDLVKELIDNHVNLYGDQYGAADLTSKTQEKAYAEYMIIVKLIRVAFKGNVNALKSYLVTGQRSRSLSGWLREAMVMYNNLLNNPHDLDILKKYGIDRDRIKNGSLQVQEISKLHSQQLEKKGEAQQSTVERDRAFDELTNWYSDFRAIARIALYAKPQLLEVLGIVKK
jgi:coenzyme F420-reducing hydrogenase delta subunit